MPEQVRLSIGTASVLGLAKSKLDVEPTTAYIMTYVKGKCTANCAFCPQAYGSSSNSGLLSRVLWPIYTTSEVLEALKEHNKKTINRVCIQAINYPSFFDDVLSMVKAIKSMSDLPISLDMPPIDRKGLEKLEEEGIDRISIPLDAVTPKIFDEVKGEKTGGPYKWDDHFNALKTAIEVLGIGRVMTNLIIGLGESERDVISLIQSLVDMDVRPSLFAFTPIPGTKLDKKPQPSVEAYRRIQVARYLIVNDLSNFQDMEFDSCGKLTGFGLSEEPLLDILKDGEAFRTSGCPYCNRPYYNERPSGPFYNYPRELTEQEAYTEARKMGVRI